MLVNIPDMDDEVIAELKRTTGARTGSRAVTLAALGYLEYCSIVPSLEKEIFELNRRLTSALQVIEGARSAAATLLERVGQTHLDV